MADIQWQVKGYSNTKWKQTNYVSQKVSKSPRMSSQEVIVVQLSTEAVEGGD